MVSLGCPKNTVDSERYSWVFEEAGWNRSGDIDSSDLVLLNTCAFIAPATEESLDSLQELIGWREEKPGRKLILAGCLPGRYPDDGSGGLEDIDLVLGPGDWRKLAVWLGIPPPGDSLLSGGGSYRYLKIAEGCSNRCAYCTIPSIRGDFRAVPPGVIEREARLLISQGAKEIGIVAQDSGSWRHGGLSFTGLVRGLLERHPDTWFRLYYLHPLHFPPNIAELLKEYPNLLPYIDMPVQHASTSVLRRMNRGYGEGELRGIMEGLENLPFDIAVRYTVITGYPGETDNDFEILRSFLGDYRCGRHIAAFTWYPEEGTPEYSRTIRRKDSVPDGVASERLAMLSAVGDALYSSWDERLTGMETDVLADDDETGHTVWDAPEVDSVVAFTVKVEPGRVVRARILDSSGAVLLAEPLDD